MRKFNKLMGLMVFGVSSLMLLNVANAGTLKTCLEGVDTTCQVTDDELTISDDNITISGTKTLDLDTKTLTFTNHKIIIPSGANLTISNGTITRTDRSIAITVELEEL